MNGRARPSPTPATPATRAALVSTNGHVARPAATGSLWNKTVYELSRRDLLRSRKAFFALLVSLIPAVIALLAVIEAESWGAPSYSPLLADGLMIGIAATVPLVCLILAGGSIADEAEERTLSYLLVRPLRRGELFISRNAAVATVAVGLALLQALLVWLVDVVSYLSMTPEPILVDGGRLSAGGALLLDLPLGLAVAGLAALLYTGMFGAISIIFTRYHFFANLVWFAVWELAFGLSHLPPAWLSGLHALVLVAHTLHPVFWGPTHVPDALHWLGWPLVAAYTVFWWYLGVRIVSRRDFHVTSAAT